MIQKLVKRDKKYGCSMIGACRVVLYSEDVAVVINSPKGCAHILRDRELNRNFHNLNAQRGAFNSVTRKIFYTGLDNEACIYGSEEYLQSCLYHVIKYIKPEYILVVNSCMVGILGDDVLATTEGVAKATGTPIITIESFGFMNGAYSNGFLKACTALIDNFTHTNLSKRKDKVLLIGPVEGRKASAFTAIQELLKMIGINEITLFPGGAQLNEIRLLAECSYGIIVDRSNMISNDFKIAAEVISNKLDIPILDPPDPIGFTRTINWLKHMAKITEASIRLIDSAIVKIEKEYNAIINESRQYYSEPLRLNLVIVETRMVCDLDWLPEVLHDLAIDIKGITIVLEGNAGTTNGTMVSNIFRIMPHLKCSVIRYLPLEELQDNFGNEPIFTIRVPDRLRLNSIPIPYVSMGYGIEGIKGFCLEIKKALLSAKQRGYYED